MDPLKSESERFDRSEEGDDGNQNDADGQDQNQRGGVQRLAQTHGTLVAYPSGDAVHGAPHPADDQQDGCQPDLESELITEASDGGDGDACGEEAEASPDPGEERTFIGEAETWIWFRSDAIDRTRPAAIAVAWSGGVSHLGASGRWSAADDGIGRGQPLPARSPPEQLPGFEALAERRPAQHGRDHRVEQAQESDRARARPTQSPEPERMRGDAADQHQMTSLPMLRAVG